MEGRASTGSIRRQVRLPFSVALEVALQGVRIRLGRSVVTLLGVLLGIAFLMAILTEQVVRKAVSDEVLARTEVKRMINFLVAEVGPLNERTLGVVRVGPLNDIERRLVAAMAEAGVRRFNWAGGLEPETAIPGAGSERIAPVRTDAVSTDASAVLIVGEGPLPGGDWSARLAGMRQRVLALSRRSQGLPVIAGVRTVGLERELRDDEREEQRRAEIREKFRTVWIIVISLLVTVIGISNAMLMSVTERFREIGTMKCLGALSSFVRSIFFIESSLMGAVGALAGVLVGAVFVLGIFSFTYGPGLVFASLNYWLLLFDALFCQVAGILLAVVAAIYPASYASRMVPATALRSTI